MAPADWPTFAEAAPWLRAWAAGFGGAAVIALALTARGGPAAQRRAVAGALGLLAVAVPSGFLTAARVPGWFGLDAGKADGVGGAVGALSAVLAVLGAVYARALIEATDREADRRPAATPTQPPPAATAPSPVRAAPPIRPPDEPPIANAAQLGGADLIAALLAGPVAARVAAARALGARPEARDPAAVRALCATARDPVLSPRLRVEAYVAAARVAGAALDWDAEAALRARGPAAFDLDAALGWEAAASLPFE